MEVELTFILELGVLMMEDISSAHAVFYFITFVNICVVHNVASKLQCLFAFDHVLADPSGSKTKTESDCETEFAPLISDA
jgi:hypothetical protein